ncbi:hypothetical protein [uncultured Tateyamaria sp.]|uniref:calcium-binding protein n=1 Tax=uncultured Tateyamaria sp. TaxID=455651 RepID=UPI00260B3FBE|nr:hypothetical protein [uncultured Tateyamaria sp.]
MVALRVTGSVGQGLGPLATGVDHLEVMATAVGPAVVALSAAGGGLVTLTFGGAGQAQIADTQSLTQAFWDQSNGNLSLIDTGDTVFVAVGSEGNNRLLGFEVDGASIGPAAALEGNGLSASQDAVYQVSGNGYLFSAGTDGTLRCFRAGDESTFNAGQVTRDEGDTFHATPGAVAALSFGGHDFLITACLEDTGISVFKVDPNSGHVAHAGAISTEMGLGLFETAVDMETAVVGGQGFVLVVTRSETSESAALSVIAVDTDGQPRVTDHILDNQLSRFGSATELEVVHHDGWTYVLASGGDDGISLFALGPLGRLVHLDTLESTTGAMLDSVSGMAAAIAQDGNLQVLLAQHTATGFAQLEVDLAGQGEVRVGTGGTLSGTDRDDMLVGSAGADVIEGGAGNDILEDGAGQDVLRGGAGANTYVLVGDGQHDVIDGFRAGVDRIDLSDVSFLYSTDQIAYSSRAWGAVITYRGETLELRSADGGMVSEWQVMAAIDWTIDRPLLVLSEADPDPEPEPEPEPRTEGTNGADTLVGGAGNDTLQAFSGNDVLDAGAGNDLIEGGTGNDTIYAGTGADTVVGDSGRNLVFLGAGADRFEGGSEAGSNQSDTIFGGDGDDTLSSIAGGDEMHGEAGNDLLYGSLDADTLFGGINFDTIHAGAGNDAAWGGDGQDLIYLNQGDDVFFDNGQGGDLGRDTVFGGLGNDTIEGGNGDDEFHGQRGNDVINARLGNDNVFGGGGSDTISAGDGNDVVYGGNGRDLVFLNEGDDVFFDNGQGGELGRDTVFGGLGNDTIEGGNGDDAFHGGTGNDVINARLGNDNIFGGDGFDTIFGGDGDDLIFGGNGQDRIYMGMGNDRYVDTGQAGDLGRDGINGGGGADTFVFGAVISEDTIFDFEVGVDTLELASELVGGRTAQQVVDQMFELGDGYAYFRAGEGQGIYLDTLSNLDGLAGSIEIF